MSSGATPRIVVVMGVSGSGKSTIARALAERLGWVYQEGDDFHPPANVEKMRASIPLNDTDRAPWLAAIRDWIDARIAEDESGVVTCSALHRTLRDYLRADRPQVCFVYLRVSREELQRRVTMRHHKYMPASLLDSQLATLEEPSPDEPQVLTVDANGTVEETVEAALTVLRKDRES